MGMHYRRYDERQVGDLVVMFTDQMLPATMPPDWTRGHDMSVNLAWKNETGDWVGADNHREVWRNAMHPTASVWFAVFSDRALDEGLNADLAEMARKRRLT